MQLYEVSMQSSQLFRQYTRSIVRGFGFLNTKHPSGLSFSKVHTLVELGLREQSTGKMISDSLCLDKSTTSRLISDLIESGFVLMEPSHLDGRVKWLYLTAKGKDKLEAINADANLHMENTVQYLTPHEKEKSIEAFKKFTKAQELSRLNHNLIVRPIQKNDNKAMKQICQDVLTEFGANRAGFAYVDEELEDLYETYVQDGWCYLICQEDTKLLGGAGIGSLKGASKAYCELKKMYISPQARGRGLGRILLNQLIKQAKEFGYQYCYLETLKSMRNANCLYQQFGFVPLEKPIGQTGHHGCDIWYVLEL